MIPSLHNTRSEARNQRVQQQLKSKRNVALVIVNFFVLSSFSRSLSTKTEPSYNFLKVREVFHSLSPSLVTPPPCPWLCDHTDGDCDSSSGSSKNGKMAFIITRASVMMSHPLDTHVTHHQAHGHDTRPVRAVVPRTLHARRKRETGRKRNAALAVSFI